MRNIKKTENRITLWRWIYRLGTKLEKRLNVVERTTTESNEINR